MRRALISGAFVVALLASTRAQADAWAWGGRVGRLEVHVTRSGFNEGAGEGGWSTGEARDFALWARRLASALPPDVGLLLVQEVEGPLQITLRRCGPRDPRCEHPRSATALASAIEGSPDDPQVQLQVLRLAAAALGQPLLLPAPRPAEPLYTLLLATARDAARATQLAERADADGVAPEGQSFYSNCLPCRIPQAHVEGAVSPFQVIAGVFESEAAARQALARLPGRYRSAARVIELR